MSALKSEAAISAEVQEIVSQEKAIEERGLALAAQYPQFGEFLLEQKKFQESVSAFWKMVEEAMIENDIKSIKGDWGSITIAERTSFDIDEAALPNKFFKRVVDTTKVLNTYKLEGKPVKGTTPKFTKYLTKRIKSEA